MHHFESDHRSNECENKKQAPKGGRLFENKNPNKHSAHGSDASPNGVGRSDGNALNGFGEKHHAQHIKNRKGNVPCRGSVATGKVGFSETERETAFKQSGKNENNPVHTIGLMG